MIRGRAAVPLLVAAFTLSGAAGLMYESLWSRYLGLFVGHSAYAQILVLVIFLGGMAVGSQLVAERSARLAQPLLWYAVIEIAVGLLALVFHPTFVAVTDFAYAGLFAVLEGPFVSLAKWILAALLILPQSVLLGATFPLMSAGVLRLSDVSRSGRLIALLYFANSIGAAVGVLVAGLWLVAAIGLPGTMMVAGALNVAVAAAVFLVGKGSDSRAPEVRAPEVRPPVFGAPDFRASDSFLLVVAFFTAVSSFIYEIAWIRMLSLVFGSSTHSFEIMLSAFILGLALGALWIHRRADLIADPLRFLARVQWAMGLLALATLPLYVEAFDWMAKLLTTVPRTDAGYRTFLGARYGIAVAIMLPATFCAGMTLPLITRMLLPRAGERAVGQVYASNTVGSIAGVLLAGLLLMPLIGVKLLLAGGAAIDVALGAWLLALRARALSGADRRRSRARLIAAGAASIAAAVALVMVVRFDPMRLGSGVFTTGDATHEAAAQFPFHRDGRTATVTVKHGADGFVSLLTNGKADASMSAEWLDTTVVADRLYPLGWDMGTQILLGVVTLAHNPRAVNGAVIGYGSGMTTHMLLGSPFLRDVATIEIEPLMVEAARAFSPANRRATEDTRSRIVYDDARSWLAASRQSWDIIVSEPSNPWVSGVAGLFTVEFYRHVARRLAPDGVFGQWLHLYDLSDELVHSAMGAIEAVFPAYEVFYLNATDILVVAANRELPDPSWDVIDYPDLKESLRRTVPFGPEWFETLRLGGRTVLHPLLSEVPAINSDFRPVLDLGAERSRFRRERAWGYEGLSTGRFDLVAALSGRKLGFGFATVSPTPDVKRSARLASATRLRAVLQRPTDRLAQRNLALDALSRYVVLVTAMRSALPPADWRGWVEDVAEVDADLHNGTAGVADTAFFRSVRGYLARASAPPEARASVEFLEATRAWDWPRAAAAATRLMASGDATAWIPRSQLRDATVTAFIMSRDTARARVALRELADTGGSSFREAMLGAILRSIDARAKGRD